MALVLTRKAGESIEIGNDITVKVVAVYGQDVRLAILAPQSMRVDRTEVREIRERRAAGDA